MLGVLDINEVRQLNVDKDVEEWVRKYARNHGEMLKQWKIDKDMGDDYHKLLQQLAYNLQNDGGQVVFARVLGRLRVIRSRLEKAQLGETDVDDMGVLL